MRAFQSAVVALVVLLLTPTGASAAQRWASPTATRATGPCLSVDPCRLDQAIAGAATGDEVVLAPGAYAVATALQPTVRITLRGARGHARPVLTGAADLGSSVLSVKAGGTLRHVEIRATAPAQDALTLEGGIAEDVVLTSVAGDGAKLVTVPGGTLLRDAVVRTDAATAGAAALKLRTSSVPGEVMLRNVTALAPDAVGIRCETAATLLNTLVRGATADIEAIKRSSSCTAASSNFRSRLAPGVVAGAGNQELDPTLGADLRPLAGSPTIDAGTADALLGATDAAGCPRTLGAAPDIGAFEFTETPCATEAQEGPAAPAPVTPAPETSTEVPVGVPAPVQGSTIVVAPGQGKVLVRRPGTKRFRALAAGQNLPVGSEIDARLGRVRLVTEVVDGLQGGMFWGGRFVVRQRRGGDGMTSLVLRGGTFRQCRRTANAASFALALASARKKPIRKLWSRDRDGRFRTHGRNSVATARGTEWVTEETCTGTRTRVFEGAVSVRDVGKKRTKLVRAGHSYLARRR